MTRQELLDFLRSELRLPALDETASMGKTRGWDSLKQVTLLLTMEQKFGVRIEPHVFGELTSVDRISSFFRDRGVLSD